ncbi:hypothetical protein KKA08_02925, partial [bacterium]|nr:hypothetical protein [bacterium]
HADPNHPSVMQATGEIWGILRFLSRCTYEAAVRIAVSQKVGRRIETLFLNHFRYHVPGLKRFESWGKLPEIYWSNEVSP